MVAVAANPGASTCSLGRQKNPAAFSLGLIIPAHVLGGRYHTGNHCVIDLGHGDSCGQSSASSSCRGECATGRCESAISLPHRFLDGYPNWWDVGRPPASLLRTGRLISGQLKWSTWMSGRGGIPAAFLFRPIVPFCAPSRGYHADSTDHGYGPPPPGHWAKDHPRVIAIGAAAAELVKLRAAWLNPPGASEAELKKRTLTNMYNQRPTWLDTPTGGGTRRCLRNADAD